MDRWAQPIGLLTVVEGNGILALKSSGTWIGHNSFAEKSELGPEETAEYLWRRFVEPLEWLSRREMYHRFCRSAGERGYDGGAESGACPGRIEDIATRVVRDGQVDEPSCF
jgi:hypothetical protein